MADFLVGWLLPFIITMVFFVYFFNFCFKDIHVDLVFYLLAALLSSGSWLSMALAFIAFLIILMAPDIELQDNKFNRFFAKSKFEK